MKKYIYLLFLMTALGVLTMSNRKGRATTVGLGSTGAPGDDATVCKSCHNGPIEVAVQITVLEQGDTILAYEPDKTYQIHIRVNNTGGNVPKAHGFQMTILNAAKGLNGPDLKDLVPLSSNVKLVSIRNGRLYAEHPERSTANLFEIQWKAPAIGSGPVTIYATGNGVNSNGDDSGDGSAKSSLQLDEKITSSTSGGQISSLGVFPNPFSDKFYLQGESSELKQIELVNLFGKTLQQFQVNETNRIFNLSELNDGIYFVKFLDANRKIIKTQKVLKRTARP
ncbi:MAG TPA: T9SS type A sorting domain-containing protein [Saprospiraceae bacterium]|nr:T9SS type A sorting domain-containing protein [Saprospiraceae bacterium]